jgi:PHP family Zn ribbon phosphoesterase
MEVANNMKILLTEKQADRVINGKVECEKCEHSWKKEEKDPNPFLCHDCGWDQKKGIYDKEGLYKFWKGKLKKNEIYNITHNKHFYNFIAVMELQKRNL